LKLAAERLLTTHNYNCISIIYRFNQSDIGTKCMFGSKTKWHCDFVKITVIQSNQTYTKCVFDFAGTKIAFD